MTAIQKELGEMADICDVCSVPVKELRGALSKDYLGKVLTFCSKECLKDYLEEPEKYAEFKEEAE